MFAPINTIHGNLQYTRGKRSMIALREQFLAAVVCVN